MFYLRTRSMARTLAATAVLSSFLLTAHADQTEPPSFVYVNAPQGYLGVDIRDVDETRAAQLKLKNAGGAEVVALDHDAPACKAGMRIHDVIVAVGGQPVTNADQLRRLMRQMRAGKRVTVDVVRDGRPVNMKLQLADRDELAQRAWKDRFHVPPMPESSFGSGGFGHQSFADPGLLLPPPAPPAAHLGVMVEPLSAQLAQFFGAPDGSGLLVGTVEEGSPAAAAGLKAGDVLLKANGAPLAAPMDLQSVVRESAGKPIQLTVWRDHHERTITVTVTPLNNKSELPPGSSVPPPSGCTGEEQLSQIPGTLDDLRGAPLGVKPEEMARMKQQLAESEDQISKLDWSAIHQEIEDARKHQAIDPAALRNQLREAQRRVEEALREYSVNKPAGTYAF